MTKTLPLIGAMLCAGAMIIPSVSHASEVTSARVLYGDLNLASAEGQSALHRRVDFAADQMCGVGRWKGLGIQDEASACSQDAVASAQPAVSAAIGASLRGSVTVLDGAALIISAR
jgi:UrcA family protein